MNVAIRNTLLTVHRWTGLTVGLVAVFLAVTGLAMVFRPQLQPVAERELRDVPACSTRLALDELVARAGRVRPGEKVLQIETFDGGLGATVVRFNGMQGVYVNSCTGAILGQQNRWGGFFGFVEWLHRLRFVSSSDDVTELIGGSVSLILAILMVAGGLALWWPGRNGLGKAIRLRPHLKGRAFDLNLHRTTGVYVCAVILMSTLTSLTFTFEWARHAIFAATSSPIPPKKPSLPAAGASILPAEAFMARTLEAVPGAREIQILYPRKPKDAVEVQTLARDAPHGLARDYIYMDPATGGIIRFTPYAATSTGYKVYRWLGALHQGQIGGWPVQLLQFLGIFGIPVLAYSGIRSYLRGRKK